MGREGESVNAWLRGVSEGEMKAVFNEFEGPCSYRRCTESHWLQKKIKEEKKCDRETSAWVNSPGSRLMVQCFSLLIVTRSRITGGAR